MSGEAIILAGVGIYIAVMLGVGFYASRKSHSLMDFIVAGRDMSLGICAVSITASWFGGGPMMGSAAAAYQGNKLEVVFDPIAAGVCLLLVGFFFARTFRRSRRLTWIEFFQIRFGPIATVIGVVADLAGAVIWMGAMLFTFGVVFESLTGTPLAIGILAGALVVVIYTMVGGLWAVAMTDLLQMLFIGIGLSVLFIVVLNDAGGWGAISAQLPEGSFRYLPASNTFSDWVHYLHQWAGNGLAAILTTAVIQRAMAARSEQVAQNAFYIAGIAYLGFGMIPVTLGVIASVTMPGVEDPNAIIPLLAVEHLHPIAVAIFVGAIISAIMSTSDSILLGCGAVVSTNLVPFFHENPSEQLRLSVARWTIPASAIISIYFAFNAESILSVMLDSIAFLLAGAIAPFILCVWWKKTNRAGGLAGMISGLITWATLSFTHPDLPADFAGFWVSLFVTICVTLTTQKIDPPRELTDIDGSPMDLSDRLGTLPLFRRL